MKAAKHSRPQHGSARRVLFVTSVPPLPATESARLRARNLIDHLLRMGFDVDVVTPGNIAPDDWFGVFGDGVQVLPAAVGELSRVARRLVRKTHYHSAVCIEVPQSQTAEIARAVHPLRLAAFPRGRESKGNQLAKLQNVVIIGLAGRKEASSGNRATCGYDGLAETAPFAVPENGFEKRMFVFAGAKRQENINALNWFVDRCWFRILGRVSDAKLIVCGGVSAIVDRFAPGIDVRGELPRGDFLRLLREASIAIDPTECDPTAGVRMVEAAAMGLPLVTRNASIENSGSSFAAECIRLATDRTAWLERHRESLAHAKQFTEGHAYRHIDSAMGWNGEGAARRRVMPRSSRGTAAFALPTALPLSIGERYAFNPATADPSWFALGWSEFDDAPALWSLGRQASLLVELDRKPRGSTSLALGLAAAKAGSNTPQRVIIFADGVGVADVFLERGAGCTHVQAELPRRALSCPCVRLDLVVDHPVAGRVNDKTIDVRPLGVSLSYIGVIET